MESLRTLRRSRALTFLDLSSLTGIPARSLAEAEYGLRKLSYAEREILALVLGLQPADLGGARPALAVARPMAWNSALGPQHLLAAALVATVATGALRGVGPISLDGPVARAELAAPSSAQLAAKALPLAAGALAGLATDPAADDADALWQRTLAALAGRAAAPPAEAVAPELLAGPPPPATPTPAPPPAPSFVLSENGPLGCPVQPAAGRVVMTQGYGVGSHAPAAIWGAVDLAVDGDGDGYAEPGASWYAPVVATHDGNVRVTLDSYPGGNHVWVMEPGGVWRTGYAHLALVMVTSGQFVRAGEVIGLLGNTGLASGPHLDYQVWRGDTNLDPTWLVGCG